MNIQLRRKQGNYKLYKLPNGAVMLPYKDGVTIDKRLKFESSGSYLDEYFKLKDNEYIIVNCDTQLIYRITDKELREVFEFNGKEDTEITDVSLEKHKKYIGKAFGYLYITDIKANYIIDGANIRIKKKHCGIINVLVYRSKYRKIMAKLQNGVEYDLERLYSEFDNRSIPKKLKEYKCYNNDNCIEYIENIFKERIIYDIEKNIGNIIKEYIDNVYDSSVLKYYAIDKPEVHGNRIRYNLADIGDFEYKIKSQKISLYVNLNKREQVIPYITYEEFCKAFTIIFALYNAREIYGMMPNEISLAGMQIVKEYKESSDRLNKVIKFAYTGDSIPKNDIEFYIKAIYLHKLLSQCRLRKGINVFRGGIHRDDTLTFKSASFALPVALCHGRSLKDTAILKWI